jgi:hypothetical protein
VIIGGNHPVWGTLDDLNSTEKVVFVYYLWRANRSGYAWPTYATVARDIGVHYGSVVRAVKMLVKTGRLELDGKGPGRADKAPNRYRVVVPP